nr:hypothetical protein Iba_chr14fCG1280 [Ipomoea batatas]
MFRRYAHMLNVRDIFVKAEDFDFQSHPIDLPASLLHGLLDGKNMRRRWLGSFAIDAVEPAECSQDLLHEKQHLVNRKLVHNQNHYLIRANMITLGPIHVCTLPLLEVGLEHQKKES